MYTQEGSSTSHGHIWHATTAGGFCRNSAKSFLNPTWTSSGATYAQAVLIPNPHPHSSKNWLEASKIGLPARVPELATQHLAPANEFSKLLLLGPMMKTGIMLLYTTLATHGRKDDNGQARLRQHAPLSLLNPHA